MGSGVVVVGERGGGEADLDLDLESASPPGVKVKI